MGTEKAVIFDIKRKIGKMDLSLFPQNIITQNRLIFKKVIVCQTAKVSIILFYPYQEYRLFCALTIIARRFVTNRWGKFRNMHEITGRKFFVYLRFPQTPS